MFGSLVWTKYQIVLILVHWHKVGQQERETCGACESCGHLEKCIALSDVSDALFRFS